MKNLIARNRNTLVFRAFYTAAVISICLYSFVRLLFFEFPMTWPEEIVFFFKVLLSGSLLIGGTLIGLKWLYFVMLKLGQRRKRLTLKLANTLFLKKNKEYVQYTPLAH